MLKQLTFIFFTFLAVFGFSQNKQVLYDFAELPQTLLSNPGSAINYERHVGVPFVSGISAQIGSTEFVLSDIFVADNVDINTKLNNLLEKLDERDHIAIHKQIEILSAGFRFKDKNYISFGFYQELDAIAYIPKDLLVLAIEGNAPYLNRSFNASQILYKADALGVIHAGISRQVNQKLTIGGRFKIYSSAANVESTNNTGSFTTNLGNNNIYVHRLQNVNLNFRTSGIIEDDEFITNPATYLGNTFLGGNLGVGLDFGFTYKVNSQLQVSGSLVDFGFINHNKNVKTNAVKGNFIFEGIGFQFNSENENDWDNLDEAFKEQLPSFENETSYISWRPTKFNAAIKYSFGEKRSKYCYDNTYKDFYTDGFGLQLFSIFRPLTQQLALTGFYEKSITNKLHTKITYTIDDYSRTNIGVGLSAQIWKVNFYGILDNLAALGDVSSAKNISAQFGFNLIFN